MELFVHRKDNRKRPAANWRRRSIVLGGTALLIAGLVVSYQWRAELKETAKIAPWFVFDNSYFSVREILVRGGEKVGGGEIVAMTGLRHGMNIWKVDPTVIERKVAKHPWVRRVLVRREFPGRIVVEVEERVPKAIVALRSLYYVDSDGMVFKEVGAGENVKFPMLTGLRPEELTPSDSKTRARIRDALRLTELMAKDAHTLSEIRFDGIDRLVVYTTAYPVALHLGSGDWGPKLQRLDRVLSLWKGNEERLAALDVSFGDQVVVRLRRARP